jgi:hypothetical protein
MKKKKAFVPIGNFKYYKPSSHVSREGQITVSAKRSLTATVIWKGNYVRVQQMIDNYPIELWKMIHNRQKGDKKVSLVRPAYALLKKKVDELKPELVEKVNKQHDYHKAMRRLKKDIATGKIGTSNSRFKSLSSGDT